MTRGRTTAVIAQEVARLPAYAVSFMAVTDTLIEHLGEEWSDPVRFRFVRVGDRGVELELRQDEPTNPPQVCPTCNALDRAIEIAEEDK